MPKDSITQFEFDDLKDSTWVSVLNVIGMGECKKFVNRIDHEYTTTYVQLTEYTRFVCHTDRHGALQVFSSEDADELPSSLYTLNLEQQAFSNVGAEKIIKRVIAGFFKIYGIMDIDLHVIKRSLKSQGETLLSVVAINKEEIIRKS